MSLYESSLLLSIDAKDGDIEQATFQHGKAYTSLCMVCNNGYILVRMSSRKVMRPVTKQLRWFEATAGGILSISLHPSAEWLACLCFNGDLQLLPIVTLVLDEKPSQSLGSYTDVSTLKQKRSATTCFCWWVNSSDITYLITGTENGEVFFYDTMKRREVGSCHVKGYVGSLQLFHIPDQHTTYLLIGIRMAHYWVMLLEHWRVMSPSHVPDDQLAGFEIVHNVAASFMNDTSDTDKYEPQLLAASYETVKLTPYKNYTMALHLRQDELVQFQNILSKKVAAYQMVPGTLFVVISDKVFFAAGYHGNKACVSVISRQGSTIRQSAHHKDSRDILLDQFIQEGALVGVFPGSADESGELGDCILVTSRHVVHVKQSLTMEQLFQQLLEKKSHNEAERLARLVGMNVQELYKVAAENSLINNDMEHALQYCLYSKCPSMDAMEMFAHHNKIEEVTKYISKLFNSDSQQALHDPKKLADILIKCFIHQRLVHNKDTSLQQQFNTFLHDNFLYQVPVAMEMLAKYHMREELVTVGKSKGRLLDVMNMLCDHGDDLKVDASIAVNQFASTFSQSNNRLFLHHMTHSAFVNSLAVKPNLIPHHMSQLQVILPHLSEESLVQLASILDPTQPTTQPLLLRAISRKRSDSTGSQVSVSSEVPDEPYPSLDQFIELFLFTLLSLYQKRQANRDRDHDSKVTKKFPVQQVQQCTLSCGISHVAAVDNNQLYTWGNAKNGKLGHSDHIEHGTSGPALVDMFNLLSIQVLSVSCGAEHTIALCQKGVYSWGSSSHGQLGLGDTLKRSQPVQVASLADKIIVAVSCGQYHSLALSDDYRTFVWGWGVHGQLGLGATDDHNIPTHLLLPQHVTAVAAGYSHTALLTIKGHVMTCGSSHYGQLGHGDQEKQSTPSKVTSIADKKIVKIACGIFHTVAVTGDQHVYYWGKQSYSQPDTFQQYRRQREMNHVLQPIICEKTKLDGGIAEVRCGSAHSLLLTGTGQVYVWGSNSRGQLGMPQISGVTTPRKLVSLASATNTIVSIGAGDDYCIAVDDTGKVWGWGVTDQAQLGTKDVITTTSDGRPCSFTPMVVMKMSGPSEQIESASLLGWDLPNLTSVDPTGEPYNSEVLNICLTRLIGYYHSSTVLRYCRQWQLWEIMARLYAILHQYPQAMECMLKHSSSDNVKQVLTTLDEYLRSLNSTEKCPENFCSTGVDLLLPVVKWFSAHSQPISLLENMLTMYLDMLAHPLGVLLQRRDMAFSTSFQLKVMAKVVENEPVTAVTSPETVSQASHEDNSRLWSEVIRNLSLGKNNGILTSETGLHFLREAGNRRTYLWSQQLPADGLVLFTCGHSFTKIQFQTVVDEFEEHLQEFPTAPPMFIAECYRDGTSHLLPFGCPYCVYSMLRKQQLQQFPDVPIRTWSPQ